ncbi:MAG TPA: hypothetical protein VF625_16230 [Longimicrobium sp.]|jgi:hypothetical protein
MKKLALNLDELEVTSFEVSSSDTAERGTVNGQALPSTESLRDYLYSWLLACPN